MEGEKEKNEREECYLENREQITGFLLVLVDVNDDDDDDVLVLVLAARGWLLITFT